MKPTNGRDSLVRQTNYLLDTGIKLWRYLWTLLSERCTMTCVFVRIFLPAADFNACLSISFGIFNTFRACCTGDILEVTYC